MTSDLRNTLDQLHQELSAAESAEDMDAEVAERLRATIHEIKSVLEKQEASDQPQHRHSDWLMETAQHFEQSHPTIAGTIRRLVDLLGQAGI